MNNDEELLYQFHLRIVLRRDCPTEIRDFFNQLAAGTLSPELLTGQAPDLTREELVSTLAQSCLPSDEVGEVILLGKLRGAEFYGRFMPLVEWLATISQSEGFVGHCHAPALMHPTLLYFAGGRAYMLQVTGNPCDLLTGDPYPESAAADLDTESDGD